MSNLHYKSVYKKTFRNLLAWGSVASLTPLSALAQCGDNEICLKQGKLTLIEGLTPGKLVGSSISIILGISGIIAFFMLLWGGVQWILAGGDKEGTEKARKRITSALIGLAIVFSAYALIFIMKALFGIDLFTFTFTEIGQ